MVTMLDFYHQLEPTRVPLPAYSIGSAVEIELAVLPFGVVSRQRPKSAVADMLAISLLDRNRRRYSYGC